MSVSYLNQDAPELGLISDSGEIWLKRLEPELAQLAETTVVVINVETGEYVVAATRLGGLDRFEERFGKSAPGFMHEIGRPVFIGGGVV
jgi:hypothetical protein